MSLSPNALRDLRSWWSLATASALLVSVACSSAALGQLPSYPGRPAPDPLELLKSDAAPRSGEVRLSVALLRTPAVEYARALTQDRGEGSFSWADWLQKAKAAGKLEAMTHPMRMENAPGQPLGAGLQKPYRFIRQGEAARLWDEITELDRPELDLELWNRMLQGLEEFPIHPQARGTVKLDDARTSAELDLEFIYSPDPATRPAQTWKHPFFAAPRVFFRPWKSRTLSQVPLREPFVVAAQMEPPLDGQLNTGNVLFLVAAVTLAPDLERKQPGDARVGKSKKPLTGAVQAWTLDVPQTEFQSWLLNRLSPEGDAQMMQKWLDRMPAGNQPQSNTSPVGLLGTASVKVSPDLNSRAVDGEHVALVESRLQWMDPTGFEPSSNRRIFRPCVSEEGTYTLRHALELSFPEDAAKDGCLADLTVTQPSQPVRWKRWKHAMEGREDDPGNLELAEANYLDREGRTLETSFNWAPGKMMLTSAVLRRGRVQVMFSRYVEDERRPPQPPPPVLPEGSFAPSPVMDRSTPLNFTVWRIETPLHWMQRELSVNPQQPRELADKLVKALSEGQARLSTLTNHTVVTGRFNSHWQAAEPVAFYGGYAANTALHRQGIYFNMRTVELKMAGETEEIWPDIAVNADRVWARLKLESSGVPAWRHWGIWQPGVAGTNGTNSGLNRPQFLSSELEISDEFILSQPQVVAVETIPDAAKPGGPAETLRWCVVRVTADQMIPHVKSKREPDQVSCVAVVMPLPANVEVPLGDENRELARRLLEEAANGERPVIEMAALHHPARVKHRVSLNTGVEYHYTNGRPQGRDEGDEASVHAGPVLPPGTVFNRLVDFEHRLVGTQISFTEDGWTLRRDGAPPQVVTDTFSDVRYEFPRGESDSGGRTTISVERPIFRVRNAAGPRPKPGQPVVRRLDAETAVVVRMMGP